MFTLKIYSARYDAPLTSSSRGEVADETTMFVSGDDIAVHALIDTPEQLAGVKDTWERSSATLNDYTSMTTDEQGNLVPMPCRLITVVGAGPDRWFLASQAWILGPDGRTIERIAP